MHTPLIAALILATAQLSHADTYTTVPYGTGTLTRGPNGQTWTTTRQGVTRRSPVTAPVPSSTPTASGPGVSFIPVKHGITRKPGRPALQPATSLQGTSLK